MTTKQTFPDFPAWSCPFLIRRVSSWATVDAFLSWVLCFLGKQKWKLICQALWLPLQCVCVPKCVCIHVKMSEVSVAWLMSEHDHHPSTSVSVSLCNLQHDEAQQHRGQNTACDFHSLLFILSSVTGKETKVVSFISNWHLGLYISSGFLC